MYYGRTPEPPDHEQMAAHWAMTVAEPLLSPATRARLEAGMEMCSLARPEWATVFFAGVLADMALTLPTDDRWRQLSSRIAFFDDRVDVFLDGALRPRAGTAQR